VHDVVAGRGRLVCRVRRQPGRIIQSTRTISARRRNQHARRVCSSTPDQALANAFTGAGPLQGGSAHVFGGQSTPASSRGSCVGSTG
jgi:hypothetical protein